MTNPIGNRKTLWAECFPEELREIIRECPIVYLPMGLCEPHGQVSALGLDTIKAEYLCRAAAERFGGIVAPTMGYHIHECGANAAWLEQEIGNENPHMTSLPPHIVLYFFLYQLRAFANAGFKGIIVLTGHSGSENDLRRAAEVFMRLVPVQIWVGSDFELSGEGDHAGKYEISQLMYMRPELVDMKRRNLERKPGSGGNYCLDPSAVEATAENGKRIVELCLERLRDVVGGMKDRSQEVGLNDSVNYDTVELAWRRMRNGAEEWESLKPENGVAIPKISRWKPYERIRITDYVGKEEH